MRVQLHRARLGARRFQRPLIRLFVVAQNVGIAIIGLHTEVQGVWLTSGRTDLLYRVSAAIHDIPVAAASGAGTHNRISSVSMEQNGHGYKV